MVQVIRYCSDCYERHTATRDANSAFFSVRKGRPSQRGTCFIGVPTGQCDTRSAVDRWLARRLRQDQAQGYGPVAGGRCRVGMTPSSLERLTRPIQLRWCPVNAWPSFNDHDGAAMGCQRSRTDTVFYPNQRANVTVLGHPPTAPAPGQPLDFVI
jgi:hypothetical protein